ncbi:vacuolar protein sorting-associated protein 13A-like isoform X1 [Penaeus monodon]|uniref:vacuolar protein sorting-associated protein 13A-like isoform X1 n=1 Tax=Penaeus monodon TaxID=6687 RepID=UPI0018A76D7E|nr:vacuolar protein sorting-associated protein 13A-like isoform X1 [Penaeus monodon]XP_037798997.1 vacuolar protein sorting-associated protein 13A-like isoform X1 [Penaeus monodon]
MEWLAKKVVAGIVNRYFGQYLEDINTQEVNDALLSGQVNLTNLKIRRDALSILDLYYGSPLPIEVKKGTIGRISLTIPYSSFFTQPVVINIEDVFVLVTPIVEYDEERERDLDRARKKQTLSHLFPDPTPVHASVDTTSLWGLLYNRIWNNLELHINNVHIRYEDATSCHEPLVIGFCLQSLAADTTNHKWKKAQVDGNAVTINKVVDFVSASLYINPHSDRQRLVKPHINSDLWQQYLQQGLDTFSINDEPFQFILQPVRCKVKMRQQMRREARVPGLLVDAVVKDAALTLSHQQYIALNELIAAFCAINTNRRFLKYQPDVPLKRHAVEWWQYAIKAVIHEYIRPYSWSRIKNHRAQYRSYLHLYKKHLIEGYNSELEADLLKIEDTLSLINIVVARMHAKIKVSQDEPEMVHPVESSGSGWFSWLWAKSGTDVIDGDDECVDIVGSRRKNGVFSSLTDDERHQLHAALVQLEAPVDNEKHRDDIVSQSYDESFEYQKVYFSLQNVSLTLKDTVHDIALATLSGFVMSAENRNGIKYQKLSAKAESFNLEAANMDQELVYVMKLVEPTPSAGYGIAFSVDLERNPMNVGSDFAVTMKLDPLELLYNQHACAEIIYFFRVPHKKYRGFEEVARDTLSEMVNTGRAAVEYAIARHKTVNLDIDIKSPYIVLPEHGSIQKGGNVLVLDMGGLKVNSEIGGQTVDLEDATRMELEERLYDRLTITVTQLQVLFADSGDEWRVHRTRDDSDSHLLPRVRVKVDLANSIHPEYRQQPRQKIDIHITPLKLNLSDSRLSHLVEFAHHLPVLHSGMIIPDSVDNGRLPRPDLDLHHCLIEPNVSELLGIRDNLLNRLKKKLIPDNTDMHATPPLLRHVRPLSSVDTISQTSLELEKYFSASDNSDDEGETWGKPVDVPGFEDNTSPKNMITVLSRFCIDEIVVGISRSNEHGERPYLMVRATHLVVESAMMDYGPAVQVTLSSLHLVDKYHHNPTGEYLELVSSPQTGCVATILYRKVRANCPDFKSHFHSCEQSLVVDFSTLNLVWHRGSIITLTNFLTLLSAKLGHIEQRMPKVSIPNSFMTWLTSGPEDPPVPSGATKWSFATHLHTLSLKLCDNEVEFLQAKIGGLQGECVFKANEKKILRASLLELVVDDLSDMTLHPRIIEIEEDRVFDIKLVHFSPTHKGVEEIDTSPHGINPDASLRIRIGRVQCVFLCKFFADLQRFMEPVLNREGTQIAFKHAEKAAGASIDELVSGRKISLSIDIHAPTVLVPQKSDSPSLLVFNLGDLKIDNLFKAVPGGGGGAIENILVELGPLQIYRAVMTLGGGLEMQEDILEPATIRADVKRSLIPQCRDLLSWDIGIHMGALCINMGQCDLNTILAVMTQNRAEAQFSDTNIHSQPLTPVDLGTPVVGDDNVGRLQAFLTHSVDIYRIADALISLDGLTVTLYTDMDEVLSSPVRDAASALCRLEVGEIEVHGDMNSDRSMDVRLTLHSFDLFDVRTDNSHAVKKIFGQYSSEMQMNFGRFSVSVPPMMDLMYKVSPNGDAAIEASVERTRLNMSVGFAIAMYKYVNGAIPSTASTSGGILNPGFVGDLGTTVDGVRIIRRPPSSVDSTSGYLSTVTSNMDDQKTLSISLKVKRPEIVLFADPDETISRVLVMRCEIHVDYSRHPGNESFHFSLDGCQVFATMYTYHGQSPYSIMMPCDIEGSWVFRSVEEGVRAELKVSHIHLHLNPPIVHLLINVVEELMRNLSPPMIPFRLQRPTADLDDLWSPKPLTANISPTHPDDEVYIKPEYPSTKPQQRLVIRCSVISVSFERQSLKSAVPVLLMKAALNTEINDWSKLMYTKAEIQLQLSCYNKEFSTWEPVIEPVSEDGKVMRPWEALIRTLQHQAQPIGIKRNRSGPHYDSVDSGSSNNRNSYISCVLDDSDSSTDEEHQDNEMVVLKPHATSKIKRSSIKRSTADLGSFTGYPLDSDSETEDGLIHKISSAFSHMFSSDSEGSEEEESSDDILEDDKKRGRDRHERSLSSAEGQDSQEEANGVFNPPQLVPDAVDGPALTPEDAETGELATCIFVDSRDHMEVSLTPHIMTSIYDLVTEYLDKPEKPQPIVSSANPIAQEIVVVNEIGPNSKVTVVAQEEVDGETRFEVLTSAKYQEPDSLPSSPASGKSRSRGESASDDEGWPEGMGDWDHLSLNSCPAISISGHSADIPFVEPVFDQLCPNPVTLYQDITKHRVQISVPGFDDLTVFVGKRSRSRIFQLSPPRNDRRYHLIVTVQVDHHTTKVIVRSPLQIMNDLPLPINICFKKSILEMLGSSLGELHARVVSPVNPFEPHVPMITLQPDQIFTVPLTVAYHSSLHIQPAAADHGVSELGVWWKELLSSSRSHILTCKAKIEQDPTIAAAVIIQEGIKLSSLQWEGLGGVLPNYVLRVVPPLAIHNHLPCTLVLTHPTLGQPLMLDPGAQTTLYKVSIEEKVILQVQVLNYLSSDWSGTLEIGAEKGNEHRTLILSHGDGDARRKLEITLYTVRSGSTAIYVYSPYWIVNKTGLPLYIRGARSKVIYELNGQEEIILFRYKRNYPHKLKIRVVESDWSRRWSCEAVGSCGVVVCTDNNRGKKYRLLAKVKQSTLKAEMPSEGVQGHLHGKLHLTKIVTLMPYFLVRNLTQRPLRFMQENDKVELWYDIPPQQCMTFWPDSENMHMVVRYRDQQVRSQHFHFNSNHSTVLRMEKGRALTASVSGVGSDNPVTVTFDRYQAGDAPVKIENWCEDVHLRLHQKGSNQTHLLAPHQSQLYTWDDPTLPHELLWNIYNRKSEDILAVINKDEHGSKCVTVTSLKPGLVRTKSQSSLGTPKTRPKRLSPRPRAKTITSCSSTDSEDEDPDNVAKTRKDKILVHWVSYKQGDQRVLLFTQSDHLAATTRLPMERATFEICIALEKLGISLVNKRHREIAYLSLMPGAPKWELEVDGVWKVPPSLELVAWLEDQYLNNRSSKVNLKGSLQIKKNPVKVEVDLAKMYMIKPFSGKLRRTKRPAVWLHYRHSQHYSFASAQIHRLQVDNQLLDAVFPSVFYPSNENGAVHPCVSSCLLLHSAAGQLTTIKHLSLVAQEFHLKLDKGFLLSMHEVLEPILPSLHPSNVHTELKKLKTPVIFSAMQNLQTNDEGPHVERVCIAGLRVRFSFSPRGTVFGSQSSQSDVLEWFLTSLGATLTEMKNISISIGHYERESIPWDKLVVDFMDHAKYQVVQQIYVLVLGLDILGNPYQRLRDLSQGVKDLIYQPALGIIEGPDEFAEGIARGAQSLMGHVVGGTADSLNLISSAIGNTIAVLSFDDDYKKKRLQRLDMQSSLPVTMIHVGKTFVMGVVHGVSGVVVKPIMASGSRLPGAQQDGVEGFFRGLGRGIMGLITKPTLGVIDSVAMACDSIRRAVDLGYDIIVRSRVPRHVSPYVAMRPYNSHEAAGMALLASLNHGHYTQTDWYFAHAPLSESERPDIVLISDKHIFKLERCSMWGGWEVSWRVAVRNLLHQPTIKDNTILLVLRQDESHSQLSGSEHQIKSNDVNVLLFLVRCIEVLTTLHMVDQPCPRNQ